ncbi:cytochrome c, partial [Pelomonas sp. KK5]|uniref:c-type cytochrome n=1 Tax=Pelomonas sp. KK5 TaxID=1855730 RepID=UPI00117D1267
GQQHLPREAVVRLLRDGVAGTAGVAGPMAEVVAGSTQHLSGPDLDAMAQYLASIPVQHRRREEFRLADRDQRLQGGKLYERHCAACHGERGEGVPGIYPALAGNRAVRLPLANNLVLAIRHGGFAPSTAGNPRPFGMPPFGQVLNPAEIAAVASFVRQSWGNAAAPVLALDVLHVK